MSNPERLSNVVSDPPVKNAHAADDGSGRFLSNA